MANTLRQKTINRIVYISIGSAIGIVILFIILLSIFNGKNNSENVKLGESNSNITVEEASTQIGKSINDASNENETDSLSIELSENNSQQDFDSEQLSTNNSASEGLDVSEQATNKTENVNSANSSQTTIVEDNIVTKIEEENTQDPIFVMPVEGEIVKQFGKEKLIYSTTLKEWTTHLGIDIKADKTTVVKASSDGIIKSIKNDPRYGLTIVIEHSNGYKTVYSNLLSTEFVKSGESVKSGQTIGTVGNTAAFEILDEPHLHFEITKDGEYLDPEMCIQ